MDRFSPAQVCHTKIGGVSERSWRLGAYYTTGLNVLATGLARGDGKMIILTLIPAVDLALLLPVWRRRKWALLLSMAMMAITLGFAAPFLLTYLAHPELLLHWMWDLLVLCGLIAGLGFGVIACLEAFGRMEPVGVQSRQGAVLKAAGWAFAGMLVLGAGLSLAPAGQGTIAQAPDMVIQVTLGHFHFMPDNLVLPAGKITALFLINRDNFDHSFDVDALNVHVSVPAGAAAVAVVKPDTADDLTYYCGVPGHRTAGMAGNGPTPAVATHKTAAWPIQRPAAVSLIDEAGFCDYRICNRRIRH